MKNNKIQWMGLGSLALVAGYVSTPAAAQKNYPARRVRLVVPFPAGGVADVLGGQIHLMFENLPVAIQHVRSNRIRAIGMTGRTRSRSMPEVPTVAETGLPLYEAMAIRAD